MNAHATAALFALAVVTAPIAAYAQSWPAKPVRLIVPFPPGGFPDTVARLIGPKMTESLGQTVLVDNRGGAAGNIGMEAVARAPADGYTLLVNTVPTVANPSFYKLSFQPERDFAPISLIVNSPSIVVVHPSVPARSLKDLIALAKAKPGAIKYYSSGAGTLTHLAVELLRYYTKIDLVHVPYRGGGPGQIALISGEVDMAITSLVTAGAHVASGRLRVLAVTSRKRTARMPDVPTVAESGVPQYEYSSWVGMLAPAGTPQAVVRQLHEHVVKAVQTPLIAERLANDGGEVVASTPEAFGKVIANEVALWGKVVRELNIKAE